MAYKFQDRIRHASKRLSATNPLCMAYIVGSVEFPVDASPILISADELTAGNASIVRTERQDFVIWRCARGPQGERGLGIHYPPKPGHILRNADGEEFTAQSMGGDEPCYTHTTSSRDRVIVHTVRTSRG